MSFNKKSEIFIKGIDLKIHSVELLPSPICNENFKKVFLLRNFSTMKSSSFFCRNFF
jgi:hypothetical protein